VVKRVKQFRQKSYDHITLSLNPFTSHFAQFFHALPLHHFVSPGFWRNATIKAWSLTAFSRSDLFNVTVFSGPSVPGTSGYSLNAFNATGAMLTNSLPNYDFDFSLMQSGSSDSCPIDHFGKWK
jgi:hypothetical protein